MGIMERVNHNRRRRNYGARDKEELINTIKKLYSEGLSQHEISRTINIPRGTISRWMVERKIIGRDPGEAGKLKSKIYNYGENFFTNIDNANKAYIVGFILGDGYIVDRKKSKRLAIVIAEEDKQVLIDIAKEMNTIEMLKLRKSKLPNEQNKVALIINSTKMCNDLIRIGIKPNKTAKEPWIDFRNEELQWAFIRGVFDADGHIGSHGKSKSTRVSFVNSYELLSNLLKFLKKYSIGENVHTISKKQGCHELRIAAKKDLKTLFAYMYKYGDLKLNRKYEKFSSLMI